MALRSVAVRVVKGVGNYVDLSGEFKHSVPGSSKRHLGVGKRWPYGKRREMNSQCTTNRSTTDI